MLRSILLSLSLVVMAALGAMAQIGTIKGTVKDAVSGEPIIGASIRLAGTALGNTADLEGNFEIAKVTPGTYELIVSFLSYKTDTVSNVTVVAGEVTTVNTSLFEEGTQLNEVVIGGIRDRASDQILLGERRNASIAVENIGAIELSVKGVNDVGSGLVKMTGITKVASRGIYVRGLGDRYNNAYLNSMPLPSPDQNKKVVELDIFPTTIVRNIAVSKTYQADQFGDVSGASIDIFTKDPAQENFLTVGLGVNYNTVTTYKDFITNRDGSSDYLGLSGSKREGPVAVDYNGIHRFNGETDPFKTTFGRQHINAPIDNNFNIDAGRSINLGTSKLGIIFSGSYRNSYRADFGPNLVLNSMQDPDKNFYRDRYAFNTNLTGLLGTSFAWNENNVIRANYLFVNNSNNTYTTSLGDDFDVDSPSTTDRLRLRSRYLQTDMHNIQLASDNTISNNLKVKWGGSYSTASTDEPDRRELSFTTPQGVKNEGTVSSTGLGGSQRYYQLTDEKEYYAFGEAAYSFGKPNSQDKRNKITIGYQRRNKDRDVSFRSYQLLFPPGSDLLNIPMNVDRLEEVLNDEAYGNGDYIYNDIVDGSNRSKANRTIDAGYAYADLNITSRLSIIPGLRVEKTDQSVDYRLQGTGFNDRFTKNKSDDFDLLPVVNAKYNITDTKILRLSGSKTLTRPNFVELVPVAYVHENLQSTVGNPLLSNSSIYNVDLKYEIFPTGSELVAFGVFYKNIDKPIEQVRSGPNFISFFNIASAQVYGFEFEFKKRISSFFSSSSKLVNGLVFDGNLSVLYSDVDTDPSKFKDQRTRDLLSAITNTSRQLQGASPYMVNLSMGYDDLFTKSSVQSSIELTYNVFGDRIYNVGTDKRGDEYEKSFGTLDLVIQNTWQSGFGVKLSAKNLLNPDIRLEQESGPNATKDDTITQSYKAGINLGLSLTYRLMGN
jgi:outer membrane receptor protein involved in Fe transport